MVSENTFLALGFNTVILLISGMLFDLLYPGTFKQASVRRSVFVGVLIGALGTLLMSAPWQFSSGITFDTRSILLSVTGLYFGLIPAASAAAVTAAFRLYQGGAGTLTGILVILVSAGLGLLWRRKKKAAFSPVSVYALGITVHVAMLILMLSLPEGFGITVIQEIWLPVMIIYPLGTLFLGFVLSQKERNIRMAAELEEHKGELEVMINSIMDGVVLTDSSGHIKMMNKAAEQMSETTAAEAMGKKLSEIAEFLEEQKHTPLLPIAAQQTYPTPLQGLLDSASGKRYRIELRHAPISDRSGRSIGEIYLFRNIEQELKTQQQMMKNVKLESIGVLAGGIAHDFNNLLGGLFGYMELAKEASEEEKVKIILEKAHEVYDRARGLTNQLLTFAKGGAPVSAQFDLESLLRKTAAFVTSGSSTAVHISTEDKLLPCYGDQNQIAQVFENIILNARQAMNDHGHIIVRLSMYEISENGKADLQPGKYVKTVIEDEGPGIPPEHIDHIFDPFYTTKPHGNGLGLAISHSVIQRHFGALEVSSVVGKGSVFTMYLPALGTKKESGDDLLSHG
jgi:PAS domain S-box-containing protein